MLPMRRKKSDLESRENYPERNPPKDDRAAKTAEKYRAGGGSHLQPGAQMGNIALATAPLIHERLCKLSP